MPDPVGDVPVPEEAVDAAAEALFEAVAPAGHHWEELEPEDTAVAFRQQAARSLKAAIASGSVVPVGEGQVAVVLTWEEASTLVAYGIGAAEERLYAHAHRVGVGATADALKQAERKLSAALERADAKGKGE